MHRTEMGAAKAPMREQALVMGDPKSISEPGG
jgi:hypothetical protein